MVGEVFIILRLKWIGQDVDSIQIVRLSVFITNIFDLKKNLKDGV